MTPEQYMAGVERTLLKNGTLPPLWAPALGLAGELGEYIEACYHKGNEEKKLELGDVLWYVFAAIRAEGLSLDFVLDVAMLRPVEPRHMTDVHVARYVDFVKKCAWHNKSYEAEELEILLGNVLSCLYKEAEDCGFDLWNEVAVANIEKLKRRYPSGFVVGGGQ